MINTIIPFFDSVHDYTDIYVGVEKISLYKDSFNIKLLSESSPSKLFEVKFNHTTASFSSNYRYYLHRKVLFRIPTSQSKLYTTSKLIPVKHSLEIAGIFTHNVWFFNKVLDSKWFNLYIKQRINAKDDHIYSPIPLHSDRYTECNGVVFVEAIVLKTMLDKQAKAQFKSTVNNLWNEFITEKRKEIVE